VAGRDFEITGARQLEALSKRLKVEGNGGFRRELLRRIRQSAQPAIPAIRQSAHDVLGDKGGLADQIAGSKIGVRTRLSGSVGVRIQGNGVHNLRRMNEGQLRHPLFGNRSHWYEQAIRPGWFAAPIELRKPRIHNGIEQAMADTARRITKG
jgi:hypothetical protein